MMPAIVNGDLDVEGANVVHLPPDWMKIDGRAVVVLGDLLPAHSGTIIHTSHWMSINHLGVCRAGDITSCEHAMVPSQFWWLIS